MQAGYPLDLTIGIWMLKFHLQRFNTEPIRRRDLLIAAMSKHTQHSADTIDQKPQAAGKSRAGTTIDQTETIFLSLLGRSRNQFQLIQPNLRFRI